MTDPLPQSRLVDYRQAAARYDGGRALGDEVLDRWWQAVSSRLPTPNPRVLDLGAGTGLFSEVWGSTWQAGDVLAVEPSPEMRAEAQAKAERSGAFRVAAGSAEAIPLDDGSVDVVWLSTVVHHLPDRVAAAEEVRRVLAPGGRLLVRGYTPGRSRIAWLEHLPGHERSDARFPTEAQLRADLEAAGLAFVDGVEVVERPEVRAGLAAPWIERMRHADSLLTALTDDEVDEGLAALRALPPETDLGPSLLTLLTFERPGS